MKPPYFNVVVYFFPGEFKYLRVLFTNERMGKTEKEISRRIGPAGAVMQSLNCTVVTERELSQKAKLFVY